jgi:hypothetical protein
MLAARKKRRVMLGYDDDTTFQSRDKHAEG